MSKRDHSKTSQRRTDAPGLPIPDFMTVAELADLLRANVFSVRRWVHEDKLPRPYANGPNGRWLFDRAEVARWIAEKWTAFDNERRTDERNTNQRRT